MEYVRLVTEVFLYRGRMSREGVRSSYQVSLLKFFVSEVKQFLEKTMSSPGI